MSERCLSTTHLLCVCVWSLVSCPGYCHCVGVTVSVCHSLSLCHSVSVCVWSVLAVQPIVMWGT